MGKLAVALTALALTALPLGGWAAAPDPTGRWRSASGNVEVEIAPCGAALCGAIVRVLGNRAMADPGVSNFLPSGDGLALLGQTRIWTRVRADGGASREDLGPAPEFAGIGRWVNSPPLTLAGLRGKVVLVDFWTAACGNCIHALPHVERWHETYAPQGLVVVGVHTPETPFEALPETVDRAVAKWKLRYPVAQDDAWATWKAYGNHYWPAVYLIDAHGRIAMHWDGEGSYGEIEAAIRELLREAQPGSGAE